MTVSEFDELPFTCPRCGGGIPNDECIGQGPGKTSRWDGFTELCNRCSYEEELLQYLAAENSEDMILAIDPMEAHPWANPAKSTRCAKFWSS